MRRRLTLLVAATTSLLLIAFLVPLALLVNTVAADRAISGATQEAESLASLVTSLDRQSLARTLEQASAASGRPVTVFLADGGVIGSPAARSAAVELAARGTSITAEAPGGREILVAVQGLQAGTAVIRTYVSDAELSRGVLRAWLVLALLAAGLLGLSLLMADQMARSLVDSTRDLAVVSHRLAAGELDARARPMGPPELHEVAAALNHLAGRIRELLAQEREAAADLSHRLRTPLTALRLEAESLRDAEDATRIGASVDTLERAITQIIADARRATRGGDGAEGCDAAEVVRDRVRFWAVLAEDQDRRLTGPVAPDPLPVALAREDLAACVDALLGNVFAHTPEGTAFTVGLEPRPTGGARLIVADDGPGFATPDPLVRGVSGTGSSGLGLDIARRAAEATGGALSIGRAEGGGALVVLELGGR
ncbi:MAG: ATP-binding protein [Actinomadura sp.]